MQRIPHIDRALLHFVSVGLKCVISGQAEHGDDHDDGEQPTSQNKYRCDAKRLQGGWLVGSWLLPPLQSPLDGLANCRSGAHHAGYMPSRPDKGSERSGRETTRVGLRVGNTRPWCSARAPRGASGSLRTGFPAQTPVHVGLATHPVERRVDRREPIGDAGRHRARRYVARTVGL